MINLSRKKTNVTPLFTLKVGAGSAIDFGGEVVSVEFTDGDNAPVTFSDVANGVAATALNVTYVLDTAVASAFEYHWTNKGVTGVTYSYQFSNAAVGQDNPKLTGTLTMPRSPLFAHEMNEDGQATTFDVTYQLDTYNKAII